MQAAIAANEALMRRAVVASGEKDLAAFKRLPKHEQAAFLAQARGEARPEAKTGRLMQAALDDIGPSPFNREHFDPAGLDELSRTVKAEGIIQPLTVRANPQYLAAGSEDDWAVATRGGMVVQTQLSKAEAGNLVVKLNRPKWELIAGERRWRAARMAKLAEAPIIVREADDRKALELQTIENNDREDLNAVDEARKFRQLRDCYMAEGMSKTQAIAAICALTGMEDATVYERLRLLDLPEKVREFIAQRRLPASHAGLLTKLHDSKTQEKLGSEFAAKEPNGDAMPFREAREIAKAAEKREKNFAEWRRQADQFTKEGLMVLSSKECEACFDCNEETDHWWFEGAGDELYVKPDEQCRLDGAGWREYQKLWKKAPPQILGRLPDGRPVVVFSRELADAAVRAGGKLRGGGGGSGRSGSVSSAEREAAKKLKAKRGVFTKVMGTLEKVSGGQGFESQEYWRFIIPALIKHCWNDVQRIVAKRRGMPKGGDHYSFLVELAGKLPLAEQRGLMLELILGRSWPSANSTGWSKEFQEACRVWKIDLPGLAKASGIEEEKSDEEEGDDEIGF